MCPAPELSRILSCRESSFVSLGRPFGPAGPLVGPVDLQPTHGPPHPEKIISHHLANCNEGALRGFLGSKPPEPNPFLLLKLKNA